MKTKYLFFIWLCTLAIFFLGSCISSQKIVVSPNFNMEQYKNIAIIQSNDQKLSNVIDSEFIKMGFNIVDNKRVQNMLQGNIIIGETNNRMVQQAAEQRNIYVGGLNNPETTQKIGALLGVNGLLILNVNETQFPSLFMKMIDTQTGSELINAEYVFKGGIVPDAAEMGEGLCNKIKEKLK